MPFNNIPQNVLFWGLCLPCTFEINSDTVVDIEYFANDIFAISNFYKYASEFYVYYCCVWNMLKMCVKEAHKTQVSIHRKP